MKDLNSKEGGPEKDLTNQVEEQKQRATPVTMKITIRIVGRHNYMRDQSPEEGKCE